MLDTKKISTITLLVAGAVTLLLISYGKNPPGISFLAPAPSPVSSPGMTATTPPTIPGVASHPLASSFPSLMPSPSGLPQSLSSEQGKTSSVHNRRCVFPLAYHIGSIDPRFGISQSQVVAALQRAEGIWEGAFSNDIFSYNPANEKGTGVYLVFDERQEEENRYREMLAAINETQAAYDSLKTDYESRQQNLGGMRADYDAHVSAYQDLEASLKALAKGYAAQSESFRKEVTYWNERGGVTQVADYERLRQEEAALKALYDQLKGQEESLARTSETLETERLNLNQYINETNILAARINELADRLNISGSKYNDAIRRVGDVVAGEGNAYEIRIFAFQGQDALVSLLAHEMGHAMGITEHASSSDSLMYYKATSGDARLTLSQDDISLAVQTCPNLVRK